MARPSDEQLVAIIREELQLAASGWSSDVDERRRKALDAYYTRPRGDEKPGRSQYVSPDIRNTAWAILAQIMPSFGTDVMVAFEPEGEDDEDAAELETGFVNTVVVERNRGYFEFFEAIQDILRERTGWIKVFVEDKTTVSHETYEYRSAEEKAAIYDLFAQKQAPNVTIDTTETKSEVRAKITTERRLLRLKSVQPEFMRWAANHDSVFLEGIPFICELHNETQASLIAQGYSRKVVEDIPTEDITADTNVHTRRRSQETWVQDRAQHELRPIIRAECVMEVADGSGGTEMMRVNMAGSTILDKEPIDYIPWVTGAALIEAHNLEGSSLYDHVGQYQNINTDAVRQWVDNLDSNNNARVAYNKIAVKSDQLAESNRPGGQIPVNGPVGDNIMAIQGFDAGQSARNLLAYSDEKRAESGGTALDMQSADRQIVDAANQSVDRQMQPKEAMSALLARNIAETLIRSAYILVHTVLRKELPGPISRQVSGKWIQSDTRLWKERDSMNVKVGLSPGERARKSAALGQIVLKHFELAQMGEEGVMFTRANYHNAVIDWCRANELDNPDRYWQDPESDEAVAALQQKAEAAQAQSEEMKQMQQIVLEQQAVNERKDRELDRYKHDTELRFKYFETNLEETIRAAIEGVKIGQAGRAQAESTESDGAAQAGSQGPVGDNRNGGGA